MRDYDYREPVTDDIVEQLRQVLETDRVDDPINWMAVQMVAHERELTELAQFVVDADAATYYEALQQAKEETEENG